MKMLVLAVGFLIAAIINATLLGATEGMATTIFVANVVGATCYKITKN